VKRLVALLLIKISSTNLHTGCYLDCVPFIILLMLRLVLDTRSVCTCWTCSSTRCSERSWSTLSAPSSLTTSSFYTGSTISANGPN